MPSGKSKSSSKGTTKGTTPEKDNSTDGALALMLQGRGFKIIDGTIKDTDGLTTETRATVVKKVLENKDFL